MTQQTPAGWYDDGAGRQRWFDGQAWTEQTRPLPPPTDVPTTPGTTSGSPADPHLHGFAPGVAPLPAKGLAVAALITGIIAFVTGWVPVWGILVGGTAATLGVLALRGRQSAGLSVTGIVLGALALLTSVLTTIGLSVAPSSSPAPSAAGHTASSSVEPTASASATTEPTPTQISQPPATSAPPTFRMPDLVGMNLQSAQDQLQALGSSQLDQQDASGQGRMQLLDSNWTVCSQEPAAGISIPTDTTVVLSSVKNDESCPGDAPKAAGIGDTVRVGDLAVKVKSAERTSKLSSVFGSKKGQWMLVTVTVSNKGKEQVIVNDSDFSLIEADGTVYSTDSDGMTYIDSDDWLFLKRINPKTSATGKALFAVPKSVKGLTLRVSTGFFGSQMADISLGKK